MAVESSEAEEKPAAGTRHLRRETKRHAHHGGGPRYEGPDTWPQQGQEEQKRPQGQSPQGIMVVATF